MNITNNAHVRNELDNLERQFGLKAQLTLDEYAELYGIDRRWASQHLRRRGIPFSKEGKSLYISTIDLAIYKAKCKAGGKPIATRGRGFEQMAERKRLGYAD